MSLEALLIVLMAGTEIFRPLRDLRSVLHQGMVGSRRPPGVHALLGRGGVARPSGSAAASRGDARAGHPSPSRMSASPIPAGAAPRMTELTFTIAAGERIGIVGPSGAGKSSIVRLLLRLFDPQAGRDPHRRPRPARRSIPERSARHDRGRRAGHLPVPRHASRTICASASQRRRQAELEAACPRRQRARLHPGAARRLRDA